MTTVQTLLLLFSIVTKIAILLCFFLIGFTPFSIISELNQLELWVTTHFEKHRKHFLHVKFNGMIWVKILSEFPRKVDELCTEEPQNELGYWEKDQSHSKKHNSRINKARDRCLDSFWSAFKQVFGNHIVFWQPSITTMENRYHCFLVRNLMQRLLWRGMRISFLEEEIR